MVVVSAGRIAEETPDNVWPAKIAQYLGTPILVASGALYFSGPLLRPPGSSSLTLYASSLGKCMHINSYVRITGISLAVAIITALAADMLTRPKERAKLFIDNAALPKIGDYLDSLAFDHGRQGSRADGVD